MYAFVPVPRLHPALPGGLPVAPGCAGVAVVGVCPPPPLWFFLGGASRCAWFSWSLSPPSSRSGCAFVCFLFFFSRGVCPCVLGVTPLAGPPLPVWSCWFRLRGPPVLLRVGGLAASCGVGGRFPGCGPFSRPPTLFFFRGGSACSSLCLPWAGARTGRLSVWSSGWL